MGGRQLYLEFEPRSIFGQLLDSNFFETKLKSINIARLKSATAESNPGYKQLSPPPVESTLGALSRLLPLGFPSITRIYWNGNQEFAGLLIGIEFFI